MDEQQPSDPNPYEAPVRPDDAERRLSELAVQRAESERSRLEVLGSGASLADQIEAEIDAIPAIDTSSRYLRDRQFWSGEGLIQPGKVTGWIFATEEKGARMK